MKTSAAGISLIKQFESCKLEAYLDASPRRIPTIGWGHTGPDVHLGLSITQERADELLAEDLAKFEAGVSKAVRVPLTQCEFDALLSWTYNCGLENLHTSTLLAKLNASHYLECSSEFGKWNHAGGKVLADLTERRAREAALFNRGLYANSAQHSALSDQPNPGGRS